MKRVVIVGGGFAGASAARLLERDFEVTLIDKKDYFEFTPSVLRLAMEPKHVEKIRKGHSEYLKNTKLIVGTVSKIDNNFVLVGKKKIGFDYLAITAGATYGVYSVKGSYDPTDSDLLLSLQSEIDEAKKILIVGGGLVGVELAGELDGDKVVLVHSGNRLIERNNEKSAAKVEKFLKKKGVEIIYGERMADKKGKYFITEKGTKIEADVCFSCVGIKANTEFMPKKWLDEKGNIKVNNFLQVENSENVFAAGDLNSVKEEKTAQAAEKHGEIIAQNIIAKERGIAMKEYESKKRPMIISVGKYYGILEKGDFTLSGFIPAIMKAFVEWKTMVKFR